MTMIVGMAVGWVVWQGGQFGLSVAHYVGAPGVSPLCGWHPSGVPVGKRDRVAAPADSSHCRPCERMLRAR